MRRITTLDDASADQARRTVRSVHAASLIAITAAVALRTPLQASAAPATGAVQSTNGAGLKKAIQSYKGKVVIVNLWATWCEPCVREFPNLVKLYDAYKGKGVVLLSVSLDEPEDRAKVDQFIQQQKATFPVLLRANAAENSDTFIKKLDWRWMGAVPTTYLFDRKGKQVGKPLIGSRTYAQFEAALKPALK